MEFIYQDLGQRRRGDVVEVQLSGNTANVLLMDSSDFSNFKSRGSYRRAVGGAWKRSPVHLTVPRAGHWYGVVYIPPGYRGQVRAGFRVLPGLLPELRQSPLADIRDAIESYPGGIDDADKQYDCFIAHAGEDKADFVRPLAVALRARGVVVWFDEFELKIGDSLRRSIDKGLIASRFGLVILSKPFFAKGWPNYELDGLVTREVAGGRQLILPIWHGIDQADVMGYSPSLADKVARKSSDISIEALADEIASVVHPEEEAA